MNSFLLTCRHPFARIGLAFLLGIPAHSLAQGLPENVTFGAAGWMQYNVIGKSSVSPNTSRPDDKGGLDGKSVLSSGALLSMDAVLSERLSISAGIGVVGSNSLAAGPTVKGGYAPAMVDPFVQAANFTYMVSSGHNSKVTLRGGLFSYIYNPDVKNLGLYLLRGPVYPGILVSGFETKDVLPTANLLGLQARHEWGAFTQDVLLSSEMELYPYFDLSPAYVASYQAHPSFRIGAGVNFHHLISVDRKLTDGYQKADRWKYVSETGDTTNLGYNGTKLMANFSFDPKHALGMGLGSLGSEDLKLYGEIALIGLDNDDAHKAIYGDYSKRMPVMLGFNLPVFRVLEHLSVEVEWYGAEFEDNLDGYKVSGTEGEPKPYPTNWGTTFDKSNASTTAPASKRDNVKWSVHGSKMVQQHIMVTFQVANDHYRPGIFDGYADSNPPRRNAIMVTPKDWYSSLKLAYFF